MPRVKPSTSAQEQIALYRSRGMQVDDAQALQWLRAVGYYRLSGYAFAFRQEGSDEFLPGTTFSDIAGLYEFDRKLRTVVHDGVERVEIGLRAAISRRVADQYGPLGHEDGQNFRPAFDHSGWLQTVRGRLERAQRQSEFIRHHVERYGGVFPFWVTAEVLDFSDLSRMLEGLCSEDQVAVADTLGAGAPLDALTDSQRKKAKKRPPIVGWFEQLSILRNSAAHHGRLWNRSFAPASSVAYRRQPGLESLPKGQSERIGGSLQMMALMIQTLSPGSRWPHRVRALVHECLVPIRAEGAEEMGLFAGWDQPGAVLGPDDH